MSSDIPEIKVAAPSLHVYRDDDDEEDIKNTTLEWRGGGLAMFFVFTETDGVAAYSIKKQGRLEFYRDITEFNVADGLPPEAVQGLLTLLLGGAPQPVSAALVERMYALTADMPPVDLDAPLADETSLDNPTPAARLGRSFESVWSEPDRAWVGLCDAYPSLSHLAATQEAALAGIIQLVAAIEADERRSAEVLATACQNDNWRDDPLEHTPPVRVPADRFPSGRPRRKTAEELGQELVDAIQEGRKNKLPKKQIFERVNKILLSDLEEDEAEIARILAERQP